MKVLMCVLLLVLALAPAAPAAEPVARTFNAPADRVWTVAEAVLKQLGWDIDKKDRTIGMIGTDSRRVDGENWGVYAKGRRHRLTQTCARPVGPIPSGPQSTSQPLGLY